MSPENARVPMLFEKDRDALSAAHFNSGVFDPKDLRILWIRNTLHLEHLYASEALLKEAGSNPRVEVLGEPFDFPFDKDGNLIANWG